MGPAEYSMRGAVAVITLNNPPVNGLGHALRRGIVEGLDRAAADPGVKAVVLAGAGKSFSAGADIREFGTPQMTADPSLHAVIQAVEASPKPVLAAIHGVAMGGGLELALACHYRVATSGAQVALPEVKLGLLPGAGGTQRLPRAVGLETALNMIVSGTSVPAAQLEGTRLFDAVGEGDVVERAAALAEAVAGRGAPVMDDMRREDRDHRGQRAALAAIEVVADRALIDQEERPGVVRVRRVGVLAEGRVEDFTDARDARLPRPDVDGGRRTVHRRNVQDLGAGAA